MFIRVLETKITLDKTFKFSACESFRDPFSRRPKYTSVYLGSLRESRLNSDVHRRIFWKKVFERLSKAGIERDSDVAELVKIGVFAKLERLQRELFERNQAAALARSAAAV